MKKYRFYIVLAVCLFAAEMVKSADIQTDLAENLLRMHIIANSDSEFDQNIKIKVRDETLKRNTYNLDEIEKAANEVLIKENVDYAATANFENVYVPQKQYKNLALPEGYYNCLNITLGKGAGQNWWCVAYPPLCFTEDVFGELTDDAKRMLCGKLTRESMDAIIKNGDVSFKFKTVEEFQKLIKLLSKQI